MKLTYKENSATDLNIIVDNLNTNLNCNFSQAVREKDAKDPSDTFSFVEMRDHYIAYLRNRFEARLISLYDYKKEESNTQSKLYVLSIADFDGDLFINNLPEDTDRSEIYTSYASFKTLKEALEAINQLQVSLIED